MALRPCLSWCRWWDSPVPFCLRPQRWTRFCERTLRENLTAECFHRPFSTSLLETSHESVLPSNSTLRLSDGSHKDHIHLIHWPACKKRSSWTFYCSTKHHRLRGVTFGFHNFLKYHLCIFPLFKFVYIYFVIFLLHLNYGTIVKSWISQHITHRS